MRAAIAALSREDPVVLIDGPSGAGKSTLADALMAAWPGGRMPRLVRLDDIYPGWGGLESGSRHLARELLAPLRERGLGRWRRWDWAAGREAEWHEVAAGAPLIVEGCGALSRASARHADLRIWLSADDRVRKARALARDRGAFDAHWDMWDAQFARFVRAQRPLALADLVVDGTYTPPALALRPDRGYIRGMSTAESSKEYVTEFVDGPLQGTSQNRSYIEGDYERELDMYVAVEGLPSQLHYLATATRQVGDTLFVSYRFDPSTSDSIEVDDQDTNI